MELLGGTRAASKEQNFIVLKIGTTNQVLKTNITAPRSKKSRPPNTSAWRGPEGRNTKNKVFFFENNN